MSQLQKKKRGRSPKVSLFAAAPAVVVVVVVVVVAAVVVSRVMAPLMDKL